MTKPKAERLRLLALDPAKRAQLLDPAEKEFAEKGYSEASLNRILAAAGMSKGQAYYYISGKADLYAAVIERAYARLISKLDIPSLPLQTAAQFWFRAEELLVSTTMVFLGDPRLAALASGIYESGVAGAALATTSQSIRAALQDFVTLGQRLGAVRSDFPAMLLSEITFSILAATDKWFAQNWAELDKQQAIELSRQVSALIEDALSPAKGDHP